MVLINFHELITEQIVQRFFYLDFGQSMILKCAKQAVKEYFSYSE